MLMLSAAPIVPLLQRGAVDWSGEAGVRRCACVCWNVGVWYACCGCQLYFLSLCTLRRCRHVQYRFRTQDLTKAQSKAYCYMFAKMLQVFGINWIVDRL